MMSMWLCSYIQINLARVRNTGSEAGRKVANWGIGDSAFVRKALEKPMNPAFESTDSKRKEPIFRRVPRGERVH